MISLLCRVSVLTAFFLTLFSTANAQQTCVVAGDSLSTARNNFAAQCDVQRVDCDPFNGQWYCASFRMSSSTPPALTIFQPEPVASEPVIAEPIISPPVVTEPGEVEPVVVEPVVVEPIASEPVIAEPIISTPVVAEPTPEVTPPIIADPVADICEDTGTIGDGWGWDGTQSCRLPVASAPEPVVADPIIETPRVCVDSAPIGDGWGWDGTQSCVLPVASNPTVLEPVTIEPVTAVVQPTFSSKSAADITDLILVTGQSNALGASTAYDETLDSPSNKVYAFTNDGWQVADLKQIWDLNWHPRNNPDTDPSNNFALHFGKSATARDNSRVIGFILATNPGAKISSWDYQSEFYNTVETKVLDAINQLPHKNALDGILWHQGESDGEDKQYYTDALYSLIYSLRNEPWVEANAPFICGETKITSVNNRLNGLNRDTDPTTACVPAEDLSTIGDDRHFDAPALRTLGARYADAYLRTSE